MTPTSEEDHEGSLPLRADTQTYDGHVLATCPFGEASADSISESITCGHDVPASSMRQSIDLRATE